MTIEKGTYSVYISFQDDDFYIPVQDIENLYFIEDIFSYSIVGKIQFNDRYGIMEFGPITGNEEIGIEYGVETDIERKFDIFKMSRILPSANSNEHGYRNMLEIIFVDKTFYKLSESYYSVSWKDTRYSDIVSNISEHALDIDDFEEWEDSNEVADLFYMPYWNPKQAIDWISERCTGSKSRLPGYLFFKNSNGSNFITLDSLLSNNDLLTVNDDDEGMYHLSSRNLTAINKILSYQLSGIDNHSKKRLKGEINVGYDFERKKILFEPYSYSKGISNHTLLGKKSLFPDIANDNTNISYMAEADKDTLKNIGYNDWFKRYCMQQTVNIIVKGHEARYAGGIIQITWPSADDKEMFNKNLDGKYLVKSITHQFTNTQPPYRQKMILIKNAYEDSDNTDLLSAKNKNMGD